MRMSNTITRSTNAAEKMTTPRGLNFKPPRLVFAEIPIIPAADCGPATEILSRLMRRLGNQEFKKLYSDKLAWQACKI